MSGYAQQQLSRASISAEEQKRAILLNVIPTALSLSLEYGRYFQPKVMKGALGKV
jgi:hypothetical protein